MRQIDVVLLTMNSGHMLKKCLDSVYANVPIKNLIVIDGYSTDRTMDILDQFNAAHGNVKIIKTKGSRAQARQEGIKHVTTEYFAFVDSDVVLCKDWFNKVQKHLSADVGAVWGQNIDIIPNIRNRHLLYFESLVARQSFNLRGGMHDTVILKESLKNLKIPPNLHAYEDGFIIKSIKKRGYKALIGSNIYCLHYKPPTYWTLKNAAEGIIMEIRCGMVYSHAFAYMLFYPVFTFYWMLQVPFSGFGGRSS
jgi:glycosyltransferase involved in cell wall biosynthesis